MQIRTPAVAGMFYPKTNQELKEVIHDCFFHEYGPKKISPASDGKKILGIVCPHAGYMYSGPIAANSYHMVSNQKPDLVIIIGPNHWGIGVGIATMKDAIWRTPLGDIMVDTESATEINRISKMIEIDFFSHSKDHSLEVQLPLLQEVYSHKFKILPIILNDQSYKASKEIGLAIARIAKNKNCIIVASSDFTHYESNDYAHKQDMALIEPILSLDIEKFYTVLREKQVTACGYGAIASTIEACKQLGATKGELIKYATSGDISGDKSSVVGYASIVFS